MTQNAPEILFKALADRQRLRIVNVLLDGEMCVGDLVDLLQLPQPTVSRNLSILRRSGLITSRKSGLWVFHDIADGDALQNNLLDSLRDLRTDTLLIEDRKAAKRLRTTGGCCPEQSSCKPSSRSKGKR